MAETNQVNTEVGKADRIEDGSGFPPFNPTTFASQLLWLAICFGLFYLVMGRVAIPRISAILETRKDKIARDLADAAKLKDETDAAIAAYEKALATARQNAAAIAAETRATLTADVDAKRHAAEASLQEKLKKAEAEIAGIKAKALAEVSGIARETAQSVVAALSTATVSPDEIAKAVDGALAR
jgi:F-type H+-transporting ATPase subunit b